MRKRIKLRVLAQVAICLAVWAELVICVERTSSAGGTCADDAGCTDGGPEVGSLDSGDAGCTPPVCSQPACGPISNFCTGGTIDCSNDCLGGSSCNATTLCCTPPNLCGAQNCGFTTDPCGNSVSCGVCGASRECDPQNQTCCTPSFSCPPGSCGPFADNCNVQQPCICSNPGDTCVGGACVSADAGADGGDPCAACCSACDPLAMNCSACVASCGAICNNCTPSVVCVPPDAGGGTDGGSAMDSGSRRDAAGNGDGAAPPLVDSGGSTNLDAQTGNGGAGVASVSGCGCRLARGENGLKATGWVALLGIALALRRRRRRDRRAAPRDLS